MSNPAQRETDVVVTLEPLPAERFDAFAAASMASHSADNVASGRWFEHESATLARQEFERLLPQRAATPDHHFYEIKADPTGPAVGFVWLSALPRGSVNVAFLFQLFVDPAHRRKGYARAALARVEEVAVSMGLAGVALNVFGSNAGAQELYRSVGYRITSLSMHKPLP